MPRKTSCGPPIGWSGNRSRQLHSRPTTFSVILTLRKDRRSDQRPTSARPAPSLNGFAGPCSTNCFSAILACYDVLYLCVGRGIAGCRSSTGKGCRSFASSLPSGLNVDALHYQSYLGDSWVRPSLRIRCLLLDQIHSAPACLALFGSTPDG